MIKMLKKCPVVTKFFEEEIVIDVKFMDGDIVEHMLINSGTSIFLVSLSRLMNYLKEAKVKDSDVKRSCVQW